MKKLKTIWILKNMDLIMFGGTKSTRNTRIVEGAAIDSFNIWSAIGIVR